MTIFTDNFAFSNYNKKLTVIVHYELTRFLKMSPVIPSSVMTDQLVFLILIIAVVNFQVRYIINPYFVKLREEAKSRDHTLKRIHMENQGEHGTFMCQVATLRSTITDSIQPLEARLDALEAVLKGIIKVESTTLNGITNRLRKLLHTGGHWGNKQRELQVQLEESSRREEVWQKAVSWV
jgi:hypothetical protein